ncbi:anti-sigma factor family protein [Dictyobacter arantiisoli]|uniref:Membrane protein n=1 Tax=Dictyobacter arantiisoli TaxID=2014874 RepID=A0A5A5TJY2_9CHLR|nr:anti-sigma factor [Dictyobacter arantiisoli]GCF11548.1 membrane protein [Dictyobacter arantiisoli]
MDCTEARRLLHAYLDAELDMADTLAVEQHLQTCPACLEIYNNYQALQTAIKTNSLYFQAPEMLQKRIRTSVRKANQAAFVARVTSWSGLSVAAVLIFALLLSLWGFTRFWPNSSGGNSLAQEVLASHVRSLMANHLVDVPSSNQHTVKPWFNGKLDFSPPVVDLTAQGFTLIGGRLDYLDNQPVAALVYKRREHIINLFIWPSAQNIGSETDTNTPQGYHLLHWTKSGLTYWAASDLNLNELQQFVRLIQDST